MIRTFRAVFLTMALAFAALVMRPLVDTVAAQDWSNLLTWSAEADAREQGVMPVKAVVRTAAKPRAAKPGLEPAPALVAQIPSIEWPHIVIAAWLEQADSGPRSGEQFLCASPRGPPGAATAEPHRVSARGAAFESPERA